MGLNRWKQRQLHDEYRRKSTQSVLSKTGQTMRGLDRRWGRQSVG
jgi:hypothetical protein